MFNKNKIFSLAVICSLAFTFSCEQIEYKESVYDTNFAYLIQHSPYNHRYIYKEKDQSFVEDPKEVEKLVNVRCTRPAPEDLEIKFKIDEAYIAEYNKKWGTDYVLLKDVELNKVRIPKGEYLSTEKITVTYKNVDVFKKGEFERYMLPISIESISGDEVVLSERRIYVLTFDVFIFKIESAQEPKGKKIEDFSGWKINPEGEPENSILNDVTDEDHNTKYYLKYGENVIDIDMGKENNVSSIGLFFGNNYYYAATYVKIKVSKDGKRYKGIGESGLGYSWGEPALFYGNLINPEKMRFIKLILQGKYAYNPNYSSRVTEIYIHEAE